jgi:hypothetical protein
MCGTMIPSDPPDAPETRAQALAREQQEALAAGPITGEEYILSGLLLVVLRCYEQDCRVALREGRALIYDRTGTVLQGMVSCRSQHVTRFDAPVPPPPEDQPYIESLH